MVLRYVLQFLFCENSKIINNSAAVEDREKMRTDMECLEFLKHSEACLAKFRRDQIFSFLVPTKLLTE